MTSLTFVRYLIGCSGCGRIYGDRIGFESLMDARMSAYAEGWRYPNWLRKDGTQSIKETADVCPECQPWTPRARTREDGYMRMLTLGEVAVLPDGAS